MVTTIELGDIAVEVVKKDIKNVHLSVHPPTGRVRIAAPSRMNLETVRVFAISKLGWIKQQQKKLREQQRETPREYLDRESHYVWGKRHLLELIEVDAAPRVELKYRKLVVRVRPSLNEERRRAVVEKWYRSELKKRVATLIEKWEQRLNVKVQRVFVQKMKTKWGGCSPEMQNLRFNSELAKKPPECTEYIVVHEMIHLLTRHHDDRFKCLMDQHLPNWKQYRQELNAAPLGHEDWSY